MFKDINLKIKINLLPEIIPVYILHPKFRDNIFCGETGSTIS
jgi:hypothetical protein